MPEPITLAANNPDMGGGEQMLMRCAEALLDLGHKVRVVSADTTTEVLDAAAAIGAEPVAIHAASRKHYLPRLRAWDRRHRSGWLWCHGLVPALATAGRPDRIVEFHQVPRGRAQQVAARIATARVRHLIVPSHDMVASVPGSRALPIWTAEITVVGRLGFDTGVERPAQPAAIGYLGRLSPDKGVDVLAQAVGSLDDGVRLLVAGDARYVPTDDARRVQAALDALGTRAVRLGHVPRADLFAQCDVAVFPSVWAEPFGLVVAEAMASGVPFIVSDAGALAEVAGPDHPWVARAGDAADLAAVITRVLSTDDAERHRVTEAARARWIDEYSPTAGRRRVAELLSHVGLP